MRRNWLSLSARLLLAISSAVTLGASAAEVVDPRYFDKLLELEVTAVGGGVYSAIGETQPPSYANAGHNNNLSFVVTSGGVMVVNGGDNNLLARSLHRAIRRLTAQPIKLVVNENGQGHAFLGNGYWADQGIPIKAHALAIDYINRHGADSFSRMVKRNREKAQDTRIFVPDPMKGDREVIQMGDTTIELIHFGPAHSAGDISVWLPQKGIVIAGDIAFHERLLSIYSDTNTADWIESFGKLEQLSFRVIVPGHGPPASLQEVSKYTKGYLQFLRDRVNDILEKDGDLSDAYAIDQGAYQHLNTFSELARKNAGRVFQMMESESF